MVQLARIEDFPESGKIRRRRFRGIAIARGDACHLCGHSRFVHEAHHDLEPVADHIIPRSHGGTSDAWNLALAHRSCNELRSNELIPDVGTDPIAAEAYARSCYER